MLDLAIHHIKMKYYQDIVLEYIHFELHAGQKIGLVGNNGCGKTSLLRVIIGEEISLEGTVHLRNGLSIGYLPQIPSAFYQITVHQVLKLAFEAIINLKKKCVIAKDKWLYHPKISTY